MLLLISVGVLLVGQTPATITTTSLVATTSTAVEGDIRVGEGYEGVTSLLVLLFLLHVFIS